MPRYTVEDWLNLFSLAFLFWLIALCTLFLAILPIRTDVPLIATPFSSSENKSPEMEDDLNIALRTGGRIVVSEHQVSRRELVRIIAAARSDRNVRILVETGTPYRYVRGVVSAARDAGRARVTFLVRPAPASRTDARESSAL